MQFPLSELRMKLRTLGASEVLVKHLAPNDNGKNQIYLGVDISSIGLLPTGEITLNESTSLRPGMDKRGPIFRAAIDLWWIAGDGELVQAPHAKLILYPQYSEVRMSGFIRGCSAAPATLFDNKRRGREVGRVLVLAPLPDGRIVAVAFAHDTGQAAALADARGEAYGVMRRFDLSGSTEFSSEDLLLGELLRIHQLGWLDPVYLMKDGSFKPCKGTNCGGVTLESHLGITPNGFAQPDFHGWEIKQHGVRSWASAAAGKITLLTPEPSGGAYVEEGPSWFVRKWGYADRSGIPDRLNFGGAYRVGGEPNSLTGLRLALSGFNEATGRMAGDGAVVLLDADDRVAASWSFAKLIDHWKKKHAKAAFVPALSMSEPEKKFCYGSRIELAEGARFNLLLQAFAYGSIYYDPGIKLEAAGSTSPRLKRRSQFRVDTRKLASLYERFRSVDISPR